MEVANFLTERYQEIFEVFSDAVVLWRPDGKIIGANGAMATLTGYPPGELRGMSVAQFLTPDDFARLVEGQRQQLTGEAVSRSYESGLIRKDGTHVVGEWATKLVTQRGKPLGVLAVIKNVTEQKLVEKALREERDRAQRYLDVAGVAIDVMDAGGNIMLLNKKSCEILGYEENEIVGQNWFDKISVDRNRARAKALFAKMITGAIELDKCHESPVVTKSGEERIMAWYNTTLLRDEAGNAIGVLGSGEDITERKQMEKALRDSEEKYRTLFEDSRDAICILTRTGKVMHANQVALDLFGHTRDEMMGLDVWETPVYPTEVERFRSEIEHRGFVRDFAMRLRKRDGTEMDCLLTFTIWRSDDGSISGYEGSIRDTTEHKRLQENLQRYVTEVTRAQEEERKRIARELHDETIQDLAMLSLDIEAVIRARKRSSDGSVKGLLQIQEKVNRIAEELSRLSHALRPNVLDHLGLVPAVKVLIGDLSKAGNVAIDLQVVGRERRLSPEVELGLFRIIQEAIRNIRKHSGAATAAVTVELDSDKVRVTIADDGDGFELPKRLGDLTAKGKLGLVGMQERAQLFDGTLSVQSSPGEGTRVVIEVGNAASPVAVHGG